MPAQDFKTSMEGFLAPIIGILKTRKPECEIHWVHPNEPEKNNSFSCPTTEVEHYLTSMMSDGYLASVRFSSTPAGGHLQIALWEEWDGSFSKAYWPASNGPTKFEAVWSGFPPKHDKS